MMVSSMDYNLVQKKERYLELKKGDNLDKMKVCYLELKMVLTTAYHLV